MSRSTELDGQAFCVDDLAAFLVGDGRPQPAKADSAFPPGTCDFARRHGAGYRSGDRREAFVRVAHMAGMHVLPDDIADMRKAG